MDLVIQEDHNGSHKVYIGHLKDDDGKAYTVILFDRILAEEKVLLELLEKSCAKVGKA